MKLTDVLRQALEFHREKKQIPRKVTLNPADLAAIYAGDQQFQVCGARNLRRCGLEWHEDAKIPIGEILLTT